MAAPVWLTTEPRTADAGLGGCRPDMNTYEPGTSLDPVPFRRAVLPAAPTAAALSSLGRKTPGGAMCPKARRMPPSSRTETGSRPDVTPREQGRKDGREGVFSNA